MSLQAVEGAQQLRTDTIVAQELRDKLQPLLDEACKIMSIARAEGYGVSWSIQPDSFGRNFRVVEIAIVKPL